MPAVAEQEMTGQQLMGLATDRSGQEARAAFERLAQEVFGLMLDPDTGYICIKKNSAGKIIKIKGA